MKTTPCDLPRRGIGSGNGPEAFIGEASWARSSSMVVGDLDVVCIAALPDETTAVLLVDSQAVLRASRKRQSAVCAARRQHRRLASHPSARSRVAPKTFAFSASESKPLSWR